MDFDLDMLTNQQILYSLIQAMDRKLDIVMHHVDEIKSYIEDADAENSCMEEESYEQDT